MPRDVFLYRYTHSDGSSKDWAYPADMPLAASALEIYHGRTGSQLRMKSTPASACKGGSPNEEARIREQEKLAKGYVFLGHYTLADNRRNLTPVVPARAEDEPSAQETQDRLAPCWYWRWRSMDGDDPTVLYAACADTAQRLALIGWTLPECKPQDSGSMLWAVLSENQAQGFFPLCEENHALMAFWLLLACQDIGVRLANEAAELVSSWPEDVVPIASETLVALGLKSRESRQLLAAVPGAAESWYFE